MQFQADILNMRTFRVMGRWIISVIVLSCMVRAATAAGFQILEQGSRQVGNAFAGTAATAEDASTILAWTDWSVFDELRVNFSRVDTILGTSSVTPEDWDDTIRIALGVLYRHDERWTFRGGVAYDETPVPDATRTPRIPDESRYWIAAGVGYRWKALEINFSYAHSFVEDATVNDTTRLRNNLVGTFDNSTDIFSIGGTLRF